MAQRTVQVKEEEEKEDLDAIGIKNLALPVELDLEKGQGVVVEKIDNRIPRDKKGRFLKNWHPPTEFKKGQHNSRVTEFKKGHIVPKGKDSLSWKGGISSSYYRKKAGECLGRKLRKNERVHHIDMDKKNNKCTNFFIYKKESEHGKSHRSLEKLVPQLFKEGIIFFKNGKYRRGSGKNR